MSIFDLDYINTVWRLLVPPDKRLPKWLAWGAAIMQHQNNFHNATFSIYALGATTLSEYDSSRTYITNDGVIYSNQAGGAYFGDNCVYRALSIHPDGRNNAGFSNKPPTGNNVVPFIPPANVTDTSSALNWLTNDFGSGYYWIKTQENFIGANIRASFSAQKLIYEYALNTWFHTTFRQPNGSPEDHISNPTGTSDIYITANSLMDQQFFFYPYSMDSYFAPSTNFIPSNRPISQYFFSDNTFPPTQYDFTINIPVAVYNALVTTIGAFGEPAVTAGHNSTKRDAAIHAFADIYCPAGGFYNIITY